MKNMILIGLICLGLAQSAAGQSSSQPGLTNFRRGLATVMFAGLGGAVLGLSTLSFYGEPQDHIGNIWTGLALGAVAGGAYVATEMQSARNSTAKLEWVPPPRPQPVKNAMLFQYQWEF